MQSARQTIALRMTYVDVPMKTSKCVHTTKNDGESTHVCQQHKPAQTSGSYIPLHVHRQNYSLKQNCIAANTILRPRTQHVAAALGTDQHAIGKPSAAEVIAYMLRKYMRENPGHAIVQLDATNACSGIDRQLPWKKSTSHTQISLWLRPNG